MRRFLLTFLSLALISGFVFSAHAQSISPDGSTITPSSGGSLVNSYGTWVLGTQIDSLGDYPVLLNGQNVGSSIKLVIYGGKMYSYTALNSWWVYEGSVPWTQTTDPTPAGGSTGTSCTGTLTNYYSNSVAVPAGYGASYDLFSSQHELEVSVQNCPTSSLTLTIGSNQSNQYIYKQGYIYQSNAWQPVNLTSGSALVSNAWYTNVAHAALPGSAPTSWTYVVGYVCTWVTSPSTGSGQTPAGVWQCGCHDTACATSAWQLQAFQAPQSQSGGGGGTSGMLPAKILNVYYWPFNSHPSISSMQSSAPQYNVLDYISAIPSGNGNANMIMNGGGEANLASMISAWKASGRVALLMVSNVGPGPLNLFSDADATNFVNSMSTLIDAYGFQGIDWDLEDSFGSSSCGGVVSATNKLKTKYGAKFIIAAVPRDYEVRGGGIWGQCMKQMGDNLDLIALQEYDSTAYGDPSFGQIKADYADLISQGFPASKILLGTATLSGTSVSGGAATAAVYANAFNFLKSTYGIRGAMVWQSDSDFNDQPSWNYAHMLGSAIGTP